MESLAEWYGLLDPEDVSTTEWEWIRVLAVDPEAAAAMPWTSQDLPRGLIGYRSALEAKVKQYEGVLTEHNLDRTVAE